MGTKWTNYDGLHFAGWGHSPPPPPPARPPLSAPPSSLALLLSSLLSLTVQFPPLASMLLPANCEWSLIIGPPTRLRSEPSQRLREETGMSKCYQRQQTARGTIRPNVHPETHQRCVVSQRGSGREEKAATVADSKNGSANSLLHTLCHCSRFFFLSCCKSHALHRSWRLQRRMTECCLPIKCKCSENICYGGNETWLSGFSSQTDCKSGLHFWRMEQILWNWWTLMLLENAYGQIRWCVIGKKLKT